jgi:glycosyltransferase involved in cell wall biosynthesis
MWSDESNNANSGMTERKGITLPSPALGALPSPPQGRTGWPWTEESPQLPDTMPDGSTWPKISVVTPSLNQGQFMEETIRSVLLQGYPNLEYLVIDGGSADGSLEIIHRYEPWLSSWVSEPDRGQSDAINKGFSKSSGEIMAWLNSDDTYAPKALATAARYFLENPECTILYGEAWHTDEGGRRLRPCRYVIDPIPRHHILNIDPMVQPATFWRRDLWLQIGGLDSSLTWGFDWDFFIRAHLRADIHYIPEFLANYRLHDEMKTSLGGMRRHRELAGITRRHGGWWQPTNLVYQAARPSYGIRSLASRWPACLRKPLVYLFSIPLFCLQRLLFGRFMS